MSTDDLSVPSLDWWLAPERPWVAKAARAQTHLHKLETQLDAYHQKHLGVDEVRSADGTKLEILIRQTGPVPIGLSTIMGDIIHNLRSALDTLAFELARRHCGGEVPINLLRQPEFPVLDEAEKYDDFFGRKAAVFGPAEAAALRAVAPGWDFYPVEMDGKLLETFQENACRDHIYTLNQLWNIDKHRRLHVTVLWPDLVYWGGGPADTGARWQLGSPPYEDGRVLGTIHAGTDGWLPENVYVDLEFRLAEPNIDHREALVYLQAVHNHVAFFVPQQLATTYIQAAPCGGYTTTWEVPDEPRPGSKGT